MGTSQQPLSRQESGQAMSWERRKEALLDFWKKISNDWIFNFSGMLAYSLLMSIFPILLALLAIAGLVLNMVSPGTLNSLSVSIASVLPSTIGRAIVNGALANLRRSSGILFVVGVVTALFTGSRLFIAIENAFGVVFRLRPRDPLHQNIMAILMVLIYIVLVPIIFLASSVADAIAHTIFPSGSGGLSGLLIRLLGLVAAFIVAAALFSAIYVIVPNRPVQWREVWKGTLIGAGLLVLYELLFPVYQSFFLKPGNYGSLAGFAIVILVFFYYLAFILLLGAEINSWASGQRQTAADVASIIHEVQAHNTTRGAAGPTAGSPTEDLQHHKGAPAMQSDQGAVEHERADHHSDMQPPKFVEATAPEPGTEPSDTPSSKIKRDHVNGRAPDSAGSGAPRR